MKTGASQSISSDLSINILILIHFLGCKLNPHFPLEPRSEDKLDVGPLFCYYLEEKYIQLGLGPLPGIDDIMASQPPPPSHLSKLQWFIYHFSRKPISDLNNTKDAWAGLQRWASGRHLAQCPPWSSRWPGFCLYRTTPKVLVWIFGNSSLKCENGPWRPWFWTW